MTENIERGEDGLPLANEKELAAMERLFSNEGCRIKEPVGFLRGGKKWLVSPYFIMCTLDEHLRHINAFVAAAKKMIPAAARESFFPALRQENPVAEGIIKTAFDIDLRGLNLQLNSLQDSPRNVPLAALQPFVKALYRQLIRVYYLTPEHASACLMEAYRLVVKRHKPSNPEGLRSDTMSAVQEIKYIYDKFFPAMYPLVLRMTSPVMLSERDLFYKNGSKVLSWLGAHPDEILFPEEESAEPPSPIDDPSEDEPQVPESAKEGLDMLERLFPQAGWEKIPAFPEEKTDFAPYFARLLQLSDTFMQLNPDHPLHFAMILFLILSELIQGLRHVEFNSGQAEDGIYMILDDWIMYNVNVFERTFGEDLKAYTHQAYSQPDFLRSGYASRLTASMHSIVRRYFLPFYNMPLHSFQKTPAGRLPPLYPRVSLLHEMLESSIRPQKAAGSDSPEAANASSPYHFDIPSPVSRRLDALCGGSGSHRRTNKALISCCVSVLSVLDWWINDKRSPAYRSVPRLIYRTEAAGSLTPSFEVAARADTDEIFKSSLKRGGPPL